MDKIPNRDMLTQNQTQITVRHINLLDEHKFKIRDLSHKNIEALICIEGIILRNSELTPEMITGYFKCVNCNCIHEVDLENAVIEEPRMCRKCSRPNTMEFNHNLSTFVDKQYVRMQEK
jgi:DNA replicative helicase MCM subunit Mcm2 (Cdc46/Mcm family)